MTADQRLILRIEQVTKAIESDQLLAACHLLDEIPSEMGSASAQARSALGRTPIPSPVKRTTTPAAAAG